MIASSACLLAALALQAPASPPSAARDATPFAFVRHVRAGDAVALSFRQTLALRLVEYETAVVAEGEENEPQKGPPVELEREQDERVSFRDEVLEAADGRATRLRRSFETIEVLSVQTVRRAGAAAQSSREQAASPLAGRSVLFTWDPERANYAASFAEEVEDEGSAELRATDARLLAPLEARADLAWFLPPAPVAVAARWQVEPATFALLSSPSGELLLEVDGNEQPTEFGRLFHEHLRGAIEARFDGLRPSAAGESAVIHVTAVLDTAFSLGADASGAAAAGDRYRFHIELAGDLLWDPAAGRARGIELAGPAELWLETRRRLEDFELLTRQRLAGRMSFRVELR